MMTKNWLQKLKKQENHEKEVTFIKNNMPCNIDMTDEFVKT